MTSFFAQGVEMFGEKAGWAGAGLLSIVLLWLFKVHLPAKDAQLERMIDGRDRLVRELVEEFRKDLADISAHVRERDQERRQDFDRALALIAATHVPPASRPPAVSSADDDTPSSGEAVRR